MEISGINKSWQDGNFTALHSTLWHGMDVGIPHPWPVRSRTLAQRGVKWGINIDFVCLLKREVFADVFLADTGQY